MERDRHRSIAAEQDHRTPRDHALSQSGDAIGQSGAMGDGRDPNLLRHLRVGQSHQNRAAFMGCTDEFSAAPADEMIGEEEVGISDQAEHRVDPVVPDRSGDGLVQVAFLIWHYEPMLIVPQSA